MTKRALGKASKDGIPPRRSFLAALSLAGTGLAAAPWLRAAGEQSGPASAKASRKCSPVARPMKNVEGKVAFVTGGSSGLGLGIAHAFLRAGMKVAISYRNAEHLKEARHLLQPAEGEFHAIKVDVRDRQAMEAAAVETSKIFGKVHVLVNNAGIVNPAPLMSTSYEIWDEMLAVNLDGVFNGIRAFLPFIQKNSDGGHIVSTASIGGLVVAGKGYGAYCVSKFAVVGMMEALRADLEGTNVGVSVLCPGLVKSNLEARLKDSPYAMDSLELGTLVLQGVRNNDLYILTHPEVEGIVRSKSEALAASFSKNTHLSDARAGVGRSLSENSIYVRELDHRACDNSAGRT